MKDIYEKIKAYNFLILRNRLMAFAERFEPKNEAIIEHAISEFDIIEKHPTWESFSKNAPAAFRSVSGLDRLNMLAGRLNYLTEASSEFLAAKKYLADMSVPESMKNLTLKIEILGSKMTLENIVKGQTDPKMLLAEFERLKDEYVRFYVHEHNDYLRTLAELSERIELTSARSFTLDRLSVIPDIVDKKSRHLPVEFGRIQKKLVHCKALTEDEFAVCGSPVCKCRFRPDEDNPIDRFLQIEDEIARAFEASSRRLSVALSKQITDDSAKEPLEKLLSAISVSNLADLPNILTDDLMEVIVRFLTKPPSAK